MYLWNHLRNCSSMNNHSPEQIVCTSLACSLDFCVGRTKNEIRFFSGTRTFNLRFHALQALAAAANSSSFEKAFNLPPFRLFFKKLLKFRNFEISSSPHVRRSSTCLEQIHVFIWLVKQRANPFRPSFGLSGCHCWQRRRPFLPPAQTWSAAFYFNLNHLKNSYAWRGAVFFKVC